MDKINIYGPTDILVLSINVDDTSYRYKAIMAENSLNLKFSLPEYIQIEVDSYVDYKAERYFLFEEQTFVKNNTRNFEYNLTLLTHEALLRTKQFKFFLSDGFGNTIPPLKVKGSFTGKPLDFLNLIVRNMNDGDTGWVVGSYIEGEQKTLSFNQITCAEFLKQVCDEYKTEYDVVLKTINMGKVEKDKANPLSLSYGKGNGLKSGVKRNNGEASKINRIYVQGGSTNIDKSKYRISNMVGSDILKIPANASKVYNGVTYVSDADGTYVQRSGLTERVRECSYENTDIFPQRIGTVSSVVTIDASKNLYDIVDSSIPVDLNYNDYMIAGEVWTIIFQTGALAGQEFDLAKYYHVADETHAAYTFEIVPKEDAGIAMPSTTLIPAVGDKYIVFHISMPQSYISTAETDLFDKAVEVLYENEIADYAFDGELDPIYTKANWLAIGSKLNAGNFVSFTDPDFSTEPVIIRINGVREYVNKPYEPSIELNNKTSSKSISSKLKELDSDEVRIDNSKRESISYTKRRWRDAVETMTLLEDALKNFAAGINPIWVQTMSILVGEESLQFRFVDDKTTPESVNDSFVWSNTTKVFGSSAAIIQHMTIGIKNLSSSHAATEYLFWDIPAYTSPVMTDLDPFYIYLKCSKTSSAGEVLMSKTPFDLDPNDGFYYFLAATLSSEVEGERSLVTTYGFTEITPGRITLDKILSPDGYQYWDMINNKFKIGNATEYLSYNENNDNLLKLVGTIEATSGLIAGWTIGVNTISKGNVILGADGSISNIIDGVTYWTLNPDGSGSVAKGNISWNAAGQASGAFTTLDNLGDFNVQGSIFASGAIVAGALNGTLPDDLPVSSPLLYGVSKYDNVTIKANANGQLYVTASGGTVVSFGTEVSGQSIQLIVAGVNKSLALAGHTHSYQPSDNDLTAIAALTGTGLLKRTGTDTWTFDTNAYLTAITKAMVEGALTGIITSHQHNYLPINGGNLTGPLTILTNTVYHAGNIPTWNQSTTGNAATATKLSSARTFALTGDVTGTITSDLESGVSIATTIAANSVALGTDTTGNYAASVGTSGNGLSLTGVAGEGTAFTVVSNATAANTPNTIMFRDGTGSYIATNGIHTGALVAGALNGTLPDDLPVATSLLYGTIKFDPTTLALNGSNQLTVIGGSGSDVSWGTPTAQYTPLTVDSVTRNFSLDGHTHDYYLSLFGGTLSGVLYTNSQILFNNNTLNLSWGGYINGKATINGNGGLNIYPLGNLFSGDVTINGNKVWNAGNFNPSSYLPLSGGTLTGQLLINGINSGDHNNGIRINRDSANWSSIILGGPVNQISGHDGVSNWFVATNPGSVFMINPINSSAGYGLDLYRNGEAKWRGNTIWNAGNDGAGSGLDADLLRGVAPSNLAVLSATKLANTKYIWGQPFNGEGDINGNLKIGYNSAIGISYSYEDQNIYNYFYGGSVLNLKVGEWTASNVNVFNIETNNGGTAKRAFSVMNNGFIGINTNNPLYNLDVNGVFRTTGEITSNNHLTTTEAANAAGHFGNIACTWGNTGGYPTLFSNAADRWIMHINPHISYIQNGVGGYTGSLTGARVRFASDTAASAYWDLGIGVNNVGADKFSIGRAGASFLSINSSADATFGGYLCSTSRIFTGFDSGAQGSISCSNWFRTNGATGWYNQTYSAGILSDTANIVRTYNTNKFKVYNTAIDSILTLGGVTAANVISSGAVVAGALNGTLPDDLPIATGSLFGVVKTGLSLNNNAGIVNINGRHYTTTSTYTDASVREITAELVLGTGNMTSGTLDQIQLAFAPLTTTRGLTGNIIATATGAGMSLTISFRKDTGSGRWYLMIYNGTASTVVRDGILISIRGQQTI